MVLRLARIIAAYAGACLCASTVSFLGVALVSPEGMGGQIGSIGFFAIIAAIFAAPVWLVSVVLAEWRGISSVYFYTVAGAIAALSIRLLFGATDLVFSSFGTGLMLFAGSLSGLIYWAIRFPLTSKKQDHAHP